MLVGIRAVIGQVAKKAGIIPAPPRPPLGYDDTLPAVYTQAASSGSHWLIIPGDDAGMNDPTLPVLMYAPGASSSANGAANSTPITPVLKEIVRQMKRPMIVTQALNTWGNAVGLAATEDAMTVAGTDLGHDTSRLLIFGASMGGLTMTTYARAHPNVVKAMATCGPVSDLTDMVDNDRGYTAGINASYPGGWSEETYGALYNPVTIAANGGFDGIPYRVWYTQDDTVCAEATIDSMVASIPGASGVKLPNGSHNSEIRTLLASEIVAFLEGSDSDTVVSRNLSGRKVTTFYRSGIFTAPSYPATLPRVLIVGGGGSPGHSIGIGVSAGGGGGGDVLELTDVVITGPTPITVGRGGIAHGGAAANRGVNGESSAFGEIAVGGGGTGGGSGASAVGNPGNRDGADGATGGGACSGGVAGNGLSGGSGANAVYQNASTFSGGAGGGAGGDAITGVLSIPGPGIIVDIDGFPFTVGEGGTANTTEGTLTVPNTGQGGLSRGRNFQGSPGSAGRVVIVE